MAYENLELIVRYDGTKDAFDKSSHKTSYINANASRVVFISGDASGNGQAIWVTNGASHRYLDMTNIDNIKSGLKHIAGLAINDEVQSFTGGAGLNFKTASGSSLKIKLNPSNTVDNNGVPYWYIEFDDSDLKAAIIGTDSDTSTDNTIIGAKAYADTLKGTPDDTVFSVTIYGAKHHATEAANAAKSEAITTVVGNATSDTKDSKTIEGTRKYVDEKVKEINDASGGVASRVIALEEAMPKKADLDSSNHILASQLPDYILGQVLFGGTVTDATATSITVTCSAQFKSKYSITETAIEIPISHAGNYQGAYFIMARDRDAFELDTTVGDWVISDGLKWQKIDNTDAVTSVAGETGAITASALAEKLSETGDANELALKSEMDSKYTKPADGIGSSDLAAEVQASLEKADNAVKSIESTDDFISVGNKPNATDNELVIEANTATVTSFSDTTDGLATVADIRDFLKAKLSVKVI